MTNERGKWPSTHEHIGCWGKKQWTCKQVNTLISINYNTSYREVNGGNE